MPNPQFSPEGRVAIVTGGANGIGLALARELKARGARHVALADMDEAALQVAADEIGGLAFAIDISDENAVKAMVADVEAAAGAIGLYCANAGIGGGADPDPDDPSSASLETFERALSVNAIAHIVAAKAMMPLFRARRSGWFLNTISAAGLLSQIGSAPYSVSKHAAIGFAESLAYTVRDQGIGVSILCPQAVRTAMIGENPDEELKGGANVDGIMEPEDVAALTLEAMQRGDFLITPHAQVRGYMQAKAANYERWIGGMAKLRRRVT
ncbi:SDR family oxidoreductase [Pacificimonas sp. WHA3]|uniref:SDR family oxidoreductase n=1 Tax=Pacificimonas pallii TaxID=2827236 RepID=A0ABS6SB23_9SPHN|nr:SDR family oxidoreductase [Pacificimonas pallii]MBV7255612.1 SDR family oxidoreductase [Pacificimonas pallii]